MTHPSTLFLGKERHLLSGNVWMDWGQLKAPVFDLGTRSLGRWDGGERGEWAVVGTQDRSLAVGRSCSWESGELGFRSLQCCMQSSQPGSHEGVTVPVLCALVVLSVVAAPEGLGCHTPSCLSCCQGMGLMVWAGGCD